MLNLANALRRQGVELFPGPWPLTQAWVRQNRGRIDILHFNWPSYYYAAPDLKQAVRDLLLFVRCVSLAQDCGYRIVWTVHNLFAHEIEQTEVDHLARVVLARLANALVIHCQSARDRLRDSLDRTGEDIFFIPHGHYIDVYPNYLSRQEARARLGLTEGEFVYLFFGYVRPYKGVSALIDAFKTQPGDSLRLIVAGHPHPASYVAELARHAGDDSRIRLDTKLIPAHEVQTYFNAADAVVLPFENVLTSGSLILALSFGKPVIAPALGGIPELVSEDIGVLYDPLRPTALAEALALLRSGLDLQRAGQNAYAKARALDWEPIGRQMADVYAYVLQKRVS